MALELRAQRSIRHTLDSLDGCFAEQITSAAHGRTLGQLVTLSLELAIADDPSNLAQGIICFVEDVDTYWVCWQRQLVTWTHGLGAVDTIAYLSGSTPGAATATPPAAPLLVQPVLAIRASDVVLFNPAPAF